MSEGAAASGALPEVVYSRDARRFSPLSDLGQLWGSRHAVRELVGANLRARYQNSVLGFGWTLLNPVLQLIVLSFVFSQVLRFNIDNYPLYLFSGLLPWQFFLASVNASAGSLVGGQGLIRKLRVFLLVFPVSQVGIALVNLVFAMAALFVLLVAFTDAAVTVHLVLVPIGMVFLVAFALGLGLICMTLTTVFRDVEHITTVLLSAGYFATPILYRLEDVPNIAPVLVWNPMTWIIEFFRCGFYDNTWPSAEAWIIAPACGLVTLAIGYCMFKGVERELVFRL